ncbi:MAG: MFS transporter [Gammaproteobacteria bacterium]|nr:MFS transporter [Gammaproteobacteria bacterium]
MSIENFKLLIHFKDYRYFWLSNLISGFALWIQATTVGLTMAEITHSPFLIAMTQFCATFSVVLISLPFALLVDSFNHFRFLQLTQMIMCVNAIALCLLVRWMPTPLVLLLGTFIYGMAYAMQLPMGQSKISQTVPPDKIKLAAFLNNWGANIARTIGPLFAGILFVWKGPSMTFLCIAVLMIFPPLYFYIKARGQPLMCARINVPILKKRMHLIIADVQSNQIFKRVAFDSFCFFILSTAVWAFLPFYARYQLGVGAKTQSIMIGVIGVGTILAGFIMPNLRKRLSLTQIQIIFTLGASLSILGLGLTKNVHLAEAFFVLFGFVWAAAVATFNGEIQAGSSIESRARLIAVYFFVMYSGLALGNYLSAVGLSYLSFPHFCIIVAALFLLKLMTLSIPQRGLST